MASPATEAKRDATPAEVEKPFRGFTVRCDRRRRVWCGRRGLADRRNFRRGRDGDLGHAGLGHLGLRHLGLEQVAASRNDPDHLALVVAERSADFADALKQAVLADMDVRPDGFHQLLLAQDAAGIPGEQPQYLQGLGPELDRLAIGRAQLGALGSSSKPEKRSTVPSHRQLSLFSPRIDRKIVPKRTGAPNIRKISECLNSHFRTSLPSDAMLSMLGTGNSGTAPRSAAAFACRQETTARSRRNHHLDRAEPDHDLRLAPRRRAGVLRAELCAMCGEFHNRTGICMLKSIRPAHDQPFEEADQPAEQGSNSMDDVAEPRPGQGRTVLSQSSGRKTRDQCGEFEAPEGSP